MMFIVNVIVIVFCLLLNKQLKKIRDKSSEKN